jgi:hypothetical protein
MDAPVSGSIAQPLTRTPPEAVSATSKLPKGWLTDVGIHQLDSSPNAGVATVTVPVEHWSWAEVIRPPRSPLPSRLSTMRCNVPPDGQDCWTRATVSVSVHRVRVSPGAVPV